MEPTLLPAKTIMRGDDEHFTLNFTETETGDAYDLRTWTNIKMEIKSEISMIAELITTFQTSDNSMSISGADHNQLVVPLFSEATKLFEGEKNYFYDLIFVASDGNSYNLIRQELIVNTNVTNN